MQNALSYYKFVSFEDKIHHFVATCLAWADCSSLGDIIVHINLSSGRLLIPVEEENKQKQSLTSHCSSNDTQG